MFRPRLRPGLLRRLQHTLWPRSGWVRAATYVAHRLRRLPGSPSRIATGFAWGAAVSFTPFMGFHFVLAATGAWITGGDIIASAIGTAVGNPWTFPFIWVGSFRLGELILGANASELSQPLSITYIFDHPQAVLLPMTIGGVMMAGVAWLISYWLVWRAVQRYQVLRQKRLAHRAARQPGKRKAAAGPRKEG